MWILTSVHIHYSHMSEEECFCLPVFILNVRLVFAV